jgi:phenylalanyl-tRNA synthetase beta chain
MRVPVSWLRDYVPLEMPLEELAARLSVTTAEIDGIERYGVADTDGNLGLFRVGRVLEAVKHPNADRLQLTQVDVGEGEPRSIVCGAWNFGAGATVAVALPGAVLPNGLTLERRKVRGEISDGMILAEDEVALGTDHVGIMLLDELLEGGAEPGTPLADVLPLAEQVLLVESTGNRPDLLSVYGMAREVAALYDLPLADMPGGQTPGFVPEEQVPIEIEDYAGCPRYIGRLFRDVTIAPSPLWLKARLLAAGMRPISNVVDVTNYVMLALGNPLHAFDFDTLQGRVIVRRARAGEKLTTLDGNERALEPEDLLIADEAHAIALAGIMGGAETEIGDGTTNVLLEAANFDPHAIFRTAERLRMSTEGQNRWVKGVDPYLAEPAANLATQLLLELTGATWVAHSDVHAGLPPRPVVTLSPQHADALIGVETPPDDQRALLQRLGFDTNGETITVPTWRARDVTREVDVIEEIARFRLDDVPFTLPERRAMFGRLTREQQLFRRVEDALAGLGFAETYTPSLRRDDTDPNALRLPEPISADFAVLRTSLLPSLVDAVRHNVDAGATGIRLFEIARVYLPQGEGALPDERVHLGAILEGGFFAAKGAVEALCGALKVTAEFAPGKHPLLHPGKTATLPAGVLGELHPTVLEGTWSAFELELAPLFQASREPVTYEDVITFPPVRQDLAFSVAEDVAAGDLVAAAHEAAGYELREMRAFDVYHGEQVGEGRKSIAFSVVFQSPERTLSDDDAAKLREAIVGALAERFGAELRA